MSFLTAGVWGCEAAGPRRASRAVLVLTLKDGKQL